MVEESKKKRVDLRVCICTGLLCSLCSGIRLSATPGTVAPPGSSVHGILQARGLEWAAYVYVYVYVYVYGLTRWY